MAKRKVIVDVEANINPFEALASTVKPAAAKDEKVSATVTPEISVLVDSILAHKADIARLEAEQKQFEEQVIAHIQPQQDDLAYAGSYTNSMTVQGVERSCILPQTNSA
jgi:apolipoprotein N-acyltransferase